MMADFLGLMPWDAQGQPFYIFFAPKEQVAQLASEQYGVQIKSLNADNFRNILLS